MEIGWIYYGFSGAIANFVVWISLFFPVFDSAIYSCVIIISPQSHVTSVGPV
jgi:hypothetical protein